MTDYRDESSTWESTLKWGMIGIGAVMGARAAYRYSPAFRKAAIETAATAGDLYRSAGVQARKYASRWSTSASPAKQASASALEYFAGIKQGGMPAASTVLESEMIESLSRIDVIQYSDDAIGDLRSALGRKYGQPIVGAPKGYRHMTVQDILTNAQKAKKGHYAIGEGGRMMTAKGYENLRSAVQSGAVDTEWIFNQDIFLREMDNGKFLIRDARLVNPAKTVSQALQRSQKFRILGMSPADPLVPSSWTTKTASDLMSPDIPINLRGRGPTKVGGDSVMQIGDNVYSVQGNQMKRVGKTDARIYTSPRLVKERAGQAGMGGQYYGPKDTQRAVTAKERIAQDPNRYKGPIGKVRKWAESGKGYRGFGIGEGYNIGPQYKHGQSIFGFARDWMNKLLNYKTAINLKTGARGAKAFAEESVIDKVKGFFKITPDKMKKNMYWASEEELGNLTLKQMKDAANLHASTHTTIESVSTPTMRLQGKYHTEVRDVAMTPGEAVGAFGRKFTTSATRVFEWATGMGVKPGTAGQTMLRLVAKGVIPTWLLVEAFKYGDFMSEEITGVSPIKMGAYGYAGAQTAKQGMLNLSGFSTLSNAADEATGGFWSSTGGTILRTAGIFGASLAIGAHPAASKATKKWAPRLGLGLAALQLTGSPGKSAFDQWDEYTGNKMVPIRRGRGWLTGPQPYEGGEVQYYRKHAVAQILDDSQYEKFGGKQAYFEDLSLLPTPHNWMGAKRILDPYAWEKRTYYDQPYPLNKGMFSEVPIAGPLLDLTAGRILKPRVMMHQQEIQRWLDTPQIPRDPKMTMIADQLNMQLPVTGRAIPKFGVAQEIGTAIKGATDFIGMPGFMLNALKEKATGSSEWFHDGPVWQTPDYQVSQVRNFFEMEWGGMLGGSELFRRMWSKDSHEVSFVNPIPNTMPDYMPGSRSMYGDTNFINFSEGDPFSKIRAPGARNLHMALNPHTSNFDKWRMLKGVAPFSRAAKSFEAGVIGAGENQVFNDAQQSQFEDVQSRMNMYDPSTAWAGEEGGSSGFQSSLPHIPWVSTKFMGAPSPEEHYRKMVRYGSDYWDWKNPYDQMLDPYLSYMSTQNPVSAAGSGALLGSIAGSRGAVVGAAYGAVSSIFSDDSISNKESRREFTEDYFDKMQYTKLRMMEERALDMNRSDLVKKIQNMQSSTMVGLDYSLDSEEFALAAKKALPSKDRGYLMALANSGMDTSEMPEYMHPIIDKLRGQGNPKMSYASRDRMVSDWVGENGGIPGGEWAGWAPGVDMQKLKAVSVAADGDNMHDYGSYEPDVEMDAYSSPYLDAIQNYGTISNPDLQNMSRMVYNNMAHLRKLGIDNGGVMITPSFGSGRSQWNINRGRVNSARQWRQRGIW